MCEMSEEARGCTGGGGCAGGMQTGCRVKVRAPHKYVVKRKMELGPPSFFALYNNPCLKCSMHRVEGKSVCSATAVLAPLPGWKVTKPTACGTLAAAPLAAGTNRGPQTKGCHPHIPFKNWRCVPGIRCSGDCSCLAFCECFRILQHIRW